MLKFLTTLLLMIGLVACRTPAREFDMRKGTGICELHHKEMRVANVPAGIGCALPYADYLEARDQKFPHSYPRQMGSRRNFEIVYICNACVLAENDWKYQRLLERR